MAGGATAPRPERAAFRFGAATIDVELDEAGTARWLAEFLTPWFAATLPGRGDLVVRMTRSADRAAALAGRQQEARLRPVPCFRLDRSLACCPGWVEPDGATIAADPEYRCYYRVLGREVEVIAAPHDPLARIGLMRVVRELAIQPVASEPETVDLHAAAFVFRGSAVLLAGGRHQGKTTLLAHALASGEAALMANDRVMIDGISLLAQGVPTVVAVRERTERLFPALPRGLPRRATLLHAGELASADAGRIAAGARLVLSPAQFAGQLAAPLEPRAPAGAIVFPEIAADEPAWSLQPLSPEEGARRLMDAIYAPHAGPAVQTVFPDALQHAPAAPVRDGHDEPGLAASRLDHGRRMRTACERLAAVVPMLQCRLGPDAYRDGAGVWLRTLPPAGTGARP